MVQLKITFFVSNHYGRVLHISYLKCNLLGLYLGIRSINLKEISYHKLKCQRSFYSSQVNITEASKLNLKVKASAHHKQKDISSASENQSPLIHYAEKGIIFPASYAVFKNKEDSQSEQAISTPEKSQVFLNEAAILKDACRHFSIKKEEDLEYQEVIGKEESAVEPLVTEIPLNPLQWRPQRVKIENLPKYYASLAKSRLTGLVVLTSMAGYAVAPAAFDPLAFGLCALGTALVSSSANSINQFFEVPFDSQMSRTQNRILVKGLLTPLHAVSFGVTSGISGLLVLYFGVNGITASLGFLNLLLYTCVYTPSKRLTIANTWIGAFVGAIPPLMGWAACTGSLEPGAFIMAGILYAWQFPHFNALSWNLRQDYSIAGYRMMSVTNPGLCRRTAVRYSGSLIVLSTMAPVCGVTTWTFAIDSFPLNIYLTYLAWRFYKDADSKSSRRLFRFSLLHLPAILTLMIISKKTMDRSQKDEKPDELL